VSSADAEARHDKMVGLVETMMTADGLRLTAYGPDGNDRQIAEDLPKAKMPHEQESLQRQTDPLVCGSHGLTEDEIRIVGGGAR
jgi:hypothetical protein